MICLLQQAKYYWPPWDIRKKFRCPHRAMKGIIANDIQEFHALITITIHQLSDCWSTAVFFLTLLGYCSTTPLNRPLIKSIFQINLDNGSKQSNLRDRNSTFINDNVSMFIRNAIQRMLHWYWNFNIKLRFKFNIYNYHKT